MSDEPLRVDRAGAAALLTLNRPEKRNALSIELRTKLAETLEALASDPGVAAIGLTGAGSGVLFRDLDADEALALGVVSRIARRA
jgi:enoyl-CoA hydratase/carnithine racemase